MSRRRDGRARLCARLGWAGVAAIAAYLVVAFGMVGQLIWFLWRSGMWVGAIWVAGVAVVLLIGLWLVGSPLVDPPGPHVDKTSSFSSRRFYIMQRQCSGNCAVWWRAGGNGYTCNLDEAELMSEAEAERTRQARFDQDFPVPEDVVRLAQRRHADVNVLRALGYGRIAE